jgi:hypothetical protein
MNIYRVHLSLFNHELKVVFCFSLSYELQIWCLFFQFFSKITFFHFIVLFCKLVGYCFLILFI